MTALMKSAEKGHVSVVGVLLQHQAEVDLRNHVSSIHTKVTITSALSPRTCTLPHLNEVRTSRYLTIAFFWSTERKDCVNAGVHEWSCRCSRSVAPAQRADGFTMQCKRELKYSKSSQYSHNSLKVLLLCISSPSSHRQVSIRRFCWLRRKVM